MDVKELRSFAKSHKFIALLSALTFFIIAVVIFEAGVLVGFHKAAFAYGWEESYDQNFGSVRSKFGLPGDDLPNPHGADGRIVSMTPISFVVVNDDEAEKTITYSSTTPIRAFTGATTSSALATGEYVVVIGSPNASGTIAAQFIRLLPAPPQD